MKYCCCPTQRLGRTDRPDFDLHIRIRREGVQDHHAGLGRRVLEDVHIRVAVQQDVVQRDLGQRAQDRRRARIVVRFEWIDQQGEWIAQQADVARQILDHRGDRVSVGCQRFNRDLPSTARGRHTLAHQFAVGVQPHEGIRLGRADEGRRIDDGDTVADDARVGEDRQRRHRRGRSHGVHRDQQLHRLGAAVARVVERMDAQRMCAVGQRQHHLDPPVAIHVQRIEAGRAVDCVIHGVDDRVAVFDHKVRSDVRRDREPQLVQIGDVVQVGHARVVHVQQIDRRPLRLGAVDRQGQRYAIIIRPDAGIARQVGEVGRDFVHAVHQRLERDLPLAVRTGLRFAGQDAVGVDSHECIRLGRAIERRLLLARDTVAQGSRVAVGRQKRRKGRRGRPIDGDHQFFGLVADIARRIGRFDAQQMRAFGQVQHPHQAAGRGAQRGDQLADLPADLARGPSSRVNVDVPRTGQHRVRLSLSQCGRTDVGIARGRAEIDHGGAVLIERAGMEVGGGRSARQIGERDLPRQQVRLQIQNDHGAARRGRAEDRRHFLLAAQRERPHRERIDDRIAVLDHHRGAGIRRRGERHRVVRVGHVVQIGRTAVGNRLQIQSRPLRGGAVDLNVQCADRVADVQPPVVQRPGVVRLQIRDDQRPVAIGILAVVIGERAAGGADVDLRRRRTLQFHQQFPERRMVEGRPHAHARDRHRRGNADHEVRRTGLDRVRNRLIRGVVRRPVEVATSIQCDADAQRPRVKGQLR